MKTPRWRMVLGKDVGYMFKFLLQHDDKDVRQCPFNGIRVYANSDKAVCVTACRVDVPDSPVRSLYLPETLVVAAKGVIHRHPLWPLFLLATMNDRACGPFCRSLFNWGIS